MKRYIPLNSAANARELGGHAQTSVQTFNERINSDRYSY